MDVRFVVQPDAISLKPTIAVAPGAGITPLIQMRLPIRHITKWWSRSEATSRRHIRPA